LLIKENKDLSIQKKILLKEKEKLFVENKKFKSLNHRLNMDCKTLLDKLHVLKGNIRVFCRVRPQTPKEIKYKKA